MKRHMNCRQIAIERREMVLDTRPNHDCGEMDSAMLNDGLTLKEGRDVVVRNYKYPY